MASTHTVQQGEYLSSIAQQYGFADWHTLYDHPQNADFKNLRPNPDIIEPGDEIFIPDKDPKQEAGATETRHKFQVATPKVFIHVVLKDSDGAPIANEPYTLTVSGLSLKGTTDGNGLVQQQIPMGADDAELSLGNLPLTWPLRIGHLDPVREEDDKSGVISGIQARLKNLGFDCGEVDNILGDKTRAALIGFQEKYGLTVDGTASDETINKIKDLHGC